MSRCGASGFAMLVGGAGALLSVALLGSPAAYADDIATLPLLPINPLDFNTVFGLPAEKGSQTPIEQSTIPFGIERQWDASYVLSGGNYQTHFDSEDYGVPDLYYHDSDVVTASDGVAPAVGTEWDHTDYYLPSWGFSFQFDTTTSLTTSAGTVDVSTLHYIPFLDGWSNEFYNGPAGIFDDVVSGNGATVIPIIDLPADPSAAGAAADFATLWSELTTTI